MLMHRGVFLCVDLTPAPASRINLCILLVSPLHPRSITSVTSSFSLLLTLSIVNVAQAMQTLAAFGWR